MAKVWQQLPHEGRAERHPWERLVEGVQLAQRSDPRRPWPNELYAPESQPATAEMVAAGWIVAGRRYAAAKGYITPDQAAHATGTGPDDYAAWLSTLAKLENKDHQYAIVQAPAKQQLYWHLLPLAVALRDDRAPDLSLATTAVPAWHLLPDDPRQAGGLDRFFADEGLLRPSATMALLESDPYLQDHATEPGVEFTVVADQSELFEFVYQTAYRGYTEPVVTYYRALLKEAGIPASRSALYASSLAALTTSAYATFQQAVDELAAPCDTDATFRSRAETACRVAEIISRHMTDVVNRLGERPGYSGAIRSVPVLSLRAPQVECVFALRACCGAHAGHSEEPIEHARECSTCVLNYPKKITPATESRATRGRERLEARGLRAAGDQSSRTVR